MNYFLLYFSTILIVFSTIGHGFLLSRIVNKELIKFNLGYVGLLGLLSLTNYGRFNCYSRERWCVFIRVIRVIRASVRVH